MFVFAPAVQSGARLISGTKTVIFEQLMNCCFASWSVW